MSRSNRVLYSVLGAIVLCLLSVFVPILEWLADPGIGLALLLTGHGRETNMLLAIMVNLLIYWALIYWALGRRKRAK